MNKIVTSVDEIVTGDIQSYFKFRELHEPTAVQAFLWLIAEMGEVAALLVSNMELIPEALVLSDQIQAGSHAEEVLLSHTNKWVRNNPNGRVQEPLAGEIGDCLMMLYKFAERSGVAPFSSLVKKMETKGWKGELPWEKPTG